MSCTKLLVVACLVIVAGCAEQPAAPQQSYADFVLHRPMPVNDADRANQCRMIREEIAKLQNKGTGLVQFEPMEFGPLGGSSLSYNVLQRAQLRDVVRKDIAILNTRADAIHCTAVFQGPPSTNTQGNFAQCLALCQQYSKAKKDQCFDSCNHY